MSPTSGQVSKSEGDSVLPWMSQRLFCKLARLCLEVCGSHGEYGALCGRRGVRYPDLSKVSVSQHSVLSLGGMVRGPELLSL